VSPVKEATDSQNLIIKSDYQQIKNSKIVDFTFLDETRIRNWRFLPKHYEKREFRTGH
jgi:hypothetical protein